MAHFAKVTNGVVTRIARTTQENIDNIGVDNEPGQWIKTSYNTRGGVHYDPETNLPSDDQTKALRKNYAGIGMTYDEDRDAFIPTQPYDSWVLNETSCLWEAPVAYPTDGEEYYWNEETQTWDAVEAE